MALSEADKTYVAEKAYTYDHNFTYYSLISGEPFLKNAFLYYFDGRKLSINTFFLEGRPFINISAIRDTIYEIIDLFQPEAIGFWGPYRDEELFRVPKDWIRYHLAEPTEFQRDLVLLLPTFKQEKVHELRRSLILASKNGIEVRKSASRQFTAKHITLIENLGTRHNPDIFDRIFYSVLSSWFTISDGVMFEVWQSNQLLGFGILDFSLLHLPIFLASFSQRAPRGIMDVLYNALINHCIEKGYQKLSLGHCYREGLYRYKMKWGQSIVQDGSWESLLVSPGSSINPERYSWLSRIL